MKIDEEQKYDFSLLIRNSHVLVENCPITFPKVFVSMGIQGQ